MRIFSLLNADGEVCNLTDNGASFFYGVDGLGTENTVEHQQVGNDYVILTDLLSQSEITGSVKFWNPGAQKQYREFVRFCQSKPLTLVYTADGTEFRKKGTVTKIEYSEGECLRAAITFAGLTPYYRELRSDSEKSSAENGKKYSFTYPYRYESTLANTVVIESESGIESPCRLTIMGPLTNPRWVHYVNNVECCSGKVIAEIPKGHRLVIDTTAVPYSIKEYNNQGEEVADRYQASDFGTQRFILLRHGNNRITVTEDNGAEIEIRAEGRIYYASV